MMLRDAWPADIPRITSIYNHAVLHTTAIWNETVVDEANRLAWLRERQQAGYPVLVAVSAAGEVAGYATFGPWRAFDGYRHTVEHSVYVHPDAQRQGVGLTLMKALIEQARAQGKHVMVAGIDAQNTGSVALHQQLGFEATGVMKEVGCKFGRWLDLTFFCLTLDARPRP
ncbi:GNAT family N-acetyltransferase [Acetobacter malorum]|uniref:Acetyltransferase n=1 Tax=Acetobacter malorum TaxID=178901 RepID=A0A1Y3G5H0_9PROT|nr:GNAT family N-acetyltransferase [Acetobacter malorum]OUJ05528.1 acetyltransferase [Acetobacter malorum]